MHVSNVLLKFSLILPFDFLIYIVDRRTGNLHFACAGICVVTQFFSTSRHFVGNAVVTLTVSDVSSCFPLVNDSVIKFFSFYFYIVVRFASI